MYNFFPPFRDVIFCGATSGVLEKLGCVESANIVNTSLKDKVEDNIKLGVNSTQLKMCHIQSHAFT
jgi:hypothetical protein